MLKTRLGSNPAFLADDLITQLVEYDTFNIGVASSNLAGVTKTIKRILHFRSKCNFGFYDNDDAI